jgi:hypothetical protein
MKIVLFAYVHNAGRSQMAAALFSRLADPLKARAISPGTGMRGDSRAVSAYLRTCVPAYLRTCVPACLAASDVRYARQPCM